MQKVRMIAQGRVQGVGFRWGVYSLALQIGGITGRVWNMTTVQSKFWLKLKALPSWPSSFRKSARVQLLFQKSAI